MLGACVGRYEARDHGLAQPYTSAVVTPDGRWLDLGARSDAERAALVGRQVAVHGARAADAIAVTAIEPHGELVLEDPLPLDVAGPRAEVEVVETSLEMFEDRAPPLATVPAPAGVAVLTAAASVRYYRFLYDAVGAPWHWWNRKRWSDDQLAAHLARPAIELHVLHERGAPVGFVELDRTAAATCEIAYFGLVPEATGRGLGRWFLAWSVHAAWRDPTLARLWVHTCTLDGPAALPTYRRIGFVAFKHDRFRQVIALGAPPC